MNTRPTAYIITVNHSQAKLLLTGNEEPSARQHMATEIHNSRCKMRHAREAKLEPEQMQLMIGVAIGDAGPVTPVKLTGIKNEIEITWTKPLEPDIEPETHKKNIK